MANKILITPPDDTPASITFADFAGDFAPTGANDLRVGTDTEVQLTLAGLANGSYRQSAKVSDLGADWAEWYFVRLAIELAATPTAGNTIDLWWAPSTSSTAGTANAAGVSGSDAAYTGYSSNAANSVKQLQVIGPGTVTAQATATVQVIDVGLFRPSSRYGSLVIKNGAGSAVHSDDVECHVVFIPYVAEIQ